MPLPHPQPLCDWITQLWNIVLGARVRSDMTWLVGPRGRPGIIDGAVLDQLAARENLIIDVVERDGGLLESFDFLAGAKARLHPDVANFYLHTARYKLNVWTSWRPGWRGFAWAVDWMFARRIKQLSLPQNPLETARGITSEIVALRGEDGRAKYRFWIRRLQQSGRTIYVGCYSSLVLNSDTPCIKVVFPLPYGSATVILQCSVEEDGSLMLRSHGNRPGEPGFYFLVEDRSGELWYHYLRRFTEQIRVYSDGVGGIRADHSMSLFGMRAFELHYHAENQTPSG
ncbi:MAG: hypothetical protein MUD03_17065 [Pirellula sp.]|jgi:hypothetical protein|nr:hypothetical protein [Pirellula sp.]